MLRASRVLVAVAARSLAEVDDGITLPQYRALVVLAHRGPLRPTELAEALTVHPSSVTRLCDRLVAKGFGHRGPAPSSRREILISLTPNGRRLVDRATARRRDEIAEIIAKIPPREREATARALQSLGDAAAEPVRRSDARRGWRARLLVAPRRAGAARHRNPARRARARARFLPRCGHGRRPRSGVHRRGRGLARAHRDRHRLLDGPALRWSGAPSQPAAVARGRAPAHAARRPATSTDGSSSSPRRSTSSSRVRLPSRPRHGR